MSTTFSKQEIRIQHVTMTSDRKVNEIHDNLTRMLPRLEERLLEMLRTGAREQIAEQRLNGPKLWLFATRDHGSLLAAEGRPAQAWQFEIGNPLTAAGMTRYQLAAGLYAPLRVILYETAKGDAVIEYDLPSTLFDQFGDDRVSRIGEELNHELDDVLKRAIA